MASDLVRIVYAAGALIAPFDQPDDDRLIAELLECYGELELGLGTLQARVFLVTARSRRTCTQCGERLRRMVCVQQSRRWCLSCFKKVARPGRYDRSAVLAARSAAPAPG